jgi:secondary thiamine-phosphate synthase enzyme
MQRFEVRTRARAELVDVTDRVQEVVRAAGLENGAALVWCPHTTAGVTIQENADPDVQRDLLLALERAAPRDAGWRHAEGNADAHVKAALVGSSQLVPVEGGALVLGTWQAVYLCEFDGPRVRTLHVRLLAAAPERPL